MGRVERSERPFGLFVDVYIRVKVSRTRKEGSGTVLGGLHVLPFIRRVFGEDSSSVIKVPYRTSTMGKIVVPLS